MTDDVVKNLRVTIGTRIKGPTGHNGIIVGIDSDYKYETTIEWEKPWPERGQYSYVFPEWITDDKFMILGKNVPFGEYDVMHRSYWADIYNFGGTRGYNQYTEDKKFMVYAIGKTIQECVSNFCISNFSKLDQDHLEELESNDSEYTWGVRFHSDGTSMKAAGVHVPGGVIMTWWK